jgi:hypothetical protein
MVIKQILEGARCFKPALSSDPNLPAGAEAERRHWRWPQWLRLGNRRKDKYLIDIRPRRLPEV